MKQHRFKLDIPSKGKVKLDEDIEKTDKTFKELLKMRLKK